jgi:Uma2 family endonuclease
MLAGQDASVSVPPPEQPLLPLENGDSMHSHEFLRRYEEMPQVKKAELIEGVVYMGSPVRVIHAAPDGIIHAWLGFYAARTPGVEFLPNATLILDSDNTFQPDALLRLLPERGGKTQVNEAGYLVGPPEFVVEVAASSASIDLRDKLRVYRRAGVAEYLVWRTAERRFDWLCLEGDDYHAQTPDAQGLLHSRTFAGLCLPAEALLKLDASQVLAPLMQGRS